MKIDTKALQPYRDAGLSIMPLRGDTKLPLTGWRKNQWEHGDAVSHILNTNGNAGLAVPEGWLVFDHDPRNDFDGGGELAAMFNRYGLNLKDFPVVETGGGGTHVYARVPEGIKFRNTVPDFGSVEIKAYGRLVVTAGGAHKSGKHYKWIDGHPYLKDAPELPTGLLEAITRPTPVSDYAPDSARIDPEELAAMLAGLDPENFGTNDLWWPILCASHHATGGAGLDEFVEWSTNDPAFADQASVIADRWRSLDKNKAGGITIGTLNKALKDADRADLMHVERVDAADDFAEAVDPQWLKGVKPKKKPSLIAIDASGVTPNNIEHIWSNRLAYGIHTALAGVGGQGKSQIMYAIIAAITTGGQWPDNSGDVAPMGNCIILSAEENPSDMIVPRLIAAGADLTKVRIIAATRDEHGRERKFNLQADLGKLEAYCKNLGDVIFIGIDPVSSYIGGDIDSAKNTQVRHVLDPITQAATKIGCAILSITHFNKGSKNKAVDRVMDSAAWVNAPRATFGVFEDPDEQHAYLLLQLKTNMKRVKGLRYRVEEVDTKRRDPKTGEPILAPRIKWDYEPVTMTADEVVSRQAERATPELDRAIDFLQSQLAFGAVDVKTIKHEMMRADLTEATMKRARARLGVRCVPVKGHIPPLWRYELPDDDQCEALDGGEI